MQKIKVQDAIGMKLCHDMTKVVPGEFKGRAFKRNHVIRPEDIDLLLSIGKEHIFVWEENAGEIHEDEAAIRIAEAVMGPNIVRDEPQEGKCVLRATASGLFKVNGDVLDGVNSIEDVTVTCRPGNFRVQPGDKLAGARIIPLVIEEERISRLEQICREQGPAFQILPFKTLKVGVVITGNEVYKGRIADKFGPVIAGKLADYSVDLLGQTYCPDDINRLDEAVAQFLAQQADFIILTGGMSVDPDDLTPGTIRRTGAEIVTYGAPIQPGNMFMMAYLGDTALVGVPGAAIHSKTTVLDVVLPRIFAGDKLTKRDFRQMAEGGLCLACPECHYPICYFGR